MERYDILPAMYNTLEVYETICKLCCKEFNLPQVAFDILTFLHNHPQYQTAKEIVAYRGIQPNLVSRYVELLVNAGYLERSTFPGDRRSICLTCTDKAKPVLDRGLEVQQRFYQIMLEGVSEQDCGHLFQIITHCGENIAQAKAALKKGESKE